MLFLLGFPVIGAVAHLWRYFQMYAPSNVLTRKVHSAPPRWRVVLPLFSLATGLVVVMHAVARAVERGAPGWLNIILFLLVWDTIKFGVLAIAVALRCSGRSIALILRRCERRDMGGSKASGRRSRSAPGRSQLNYVTAADRDGL